MPHYVVYDEYSRYPYWAGEAEDAQDAIDRMRAELGDEREYIPLGEDPPAPWREEAVGVYELEAPLPPGMLAAADRDGAGLRMCWNWIVDHGFLAGYWRIVEEPDGEEAEGA